MSNLSDSQIERSSSTTNTVGWVLDMEAPRLCGRVESLAKGAGHDTAAAAFSTPTNGRQSRLSVTDPRVTPPESRLGSMPSPATPMNDPSSAGIVAVVVDDAGVLRALAYLL